MGQYENLLFALMSGAKDRKVPSPVHAPGLYRRDPVQYAARRPTRRHDQPADHPKQTCRRHRKNRYPLLRAPRAASHERLYHALPEHAGQICNGARRLVF